MTALTMMRQAYQSGMSISAIPAALAEAGYLSRAGKPFDRSSVRNAVKEARQ